MKRLLCLIMLFMYSNSYAACIGPYCWDDTGATIAGVKFNGSFGTTTTPAGSNTQIQYNNSNVFGASPDLTWDNANGNMFINGFVYLEGITTQFGDGLNTADIAIADASNTTRLLGTFGGFNGSLYLLDEINGGTFQIKSRANVGNAPAPTAIFEVDASTQGFLMPRLTTAQRNAIVSPAEGLFVVNISSHILEYYNGSGWRALAGTAE